MSLIIQYLPSTVAIIFGLLQDMVLRLHTMTPGIYIISILCIVGTLNVMPTPRQDYISRVKETRDSHETIKALQRMVKVDGAGSWPPKATHRDSWPKALQPYHDIFQELAALISVDTVSTNDEINQSRRLEYRKRLQRLLKERINLEAVQSVFAISDQAGSTGLQGVACNGFFACIANLRHGFRWGTVPIVKVAQEEKIIDFPQELDIPWAFLQRRYGVNSQGGNLMSNFHCNFDSNGELVYKLNNGMAEPVPSAEYNLVYSFTGTEKESLPVYYHLAQAIAAFERNQKQQCSQQLAQVNWHLRNTMRVYYEYVVSSKIPHSLFVGYIQGFHGWAAGKFVDGKFKEYDGLSGGHLILFNLLDGFFGFEHFLNDESRLNYIPATQREFIESVKKHGFREEAERAGDVEVKKQLDGILKQLRTFRSAHKTRTNRYMSVERPERVVMTAGASIPKGGAKGTAQDLAKSVDDALAKQLKNTV
ncbi:hypothetical protein N7532_001609 [Penicillium argentinense]|uniref:Indoleamine 2,3-dioxygenase n=1 Tax=Penicillium argentinense TaxID=1131581 RepID=A0A9W9KLF1_9EURO|nr:uncharacterized protein N7532_001609 [Penicillium argentinense]KAJ5111074.1 hypothetical protein N7532_001609 [Penicillium argentinense]